MLCIYQVYVFVLTDIYANVQKRILLVNKC